MSARVYKKGNIVKVLDSTKRCWYVAKITGIIKSNQLDGGGYEYVRLGLKRVRGRESRHFLDLEERRGMCTEIILGEASPEEVFEAASDFLSIVSNKITSLDPFHVHMR